ncbi:hypothetical protein [Prosthecobacter fluviatilis]|uniref:HEPN domain-containing protein n=1 Tax=Prosthecobacter fluviatilis TaxID=445931 RepID=A0ABW0KSE3_9BACT
MHTSGPVFDKQTPVCLLLTAGSFYDCARLCRAASEGNGELLKFIPDHKSYLRPAIYATACRAIELALKAYLRAAGDTEKQFRKKGGANGHDLIQLYEAAITSGMNRLSLSPKDKSDFQELSERYHGKDFDYPDVTSSRGAPSLDFAIRIAKEAIVSVEPFCRANDNRHLNQLSADVGFEAKRNQKVKKTAQKI